MPLGDDLIELFGVGSFIRRGVEVSGETYRMCRR